MPTNQPLLESAATNTSPKPSRRLSKLTIGFGAPVQISVQETLDLAIERLVNIAHRVTGPGIFDSLIGMHKVVSNLGTETDSSFVLIIGRILGFTLFFLDPCDRRPQHLPGLSPVLVLASLALALNHGSCRNVGQANRAIGRVNVLPAGSLSAIGIGSNL